MASITHRFPGITRETLLRRNLRRHWQAPVAFVLICVAVTAISIPYLHLEAQVNNMAYDVVELGLQRADLRRQVAELERQLAEARSAANIAKGADDLGLGRSDLVLVLPVDMDQGLPVEASALDRLAGDFSRWRDTWLSGNRAVDAGR